MEDYVLENMEELAEYLDKLGFIGTDISPDVALFEYGILWHPESGTLIQTYPDYVWDEMGAEEPEFSVTTVDTDEIEEEIEGMDDGFFKFIGISKEEYLDDFDSDWSYVNAISDANSYSGTWTPYGGMNWSIGDIYENIRSWVEE